MPSLVISAIVRVKNIFHLSGSLNTLLMKEQ